jgi:hypothetical protein
MPTTGQKDAQGYIWNGSQWVSPDGYAKGSAEDKRKNRSGFRNLLSDLGGIGKDLTKAETWANPGGENATGAFGFVNAANRVFNPFTSIGQAKLEYNKGNYAGIASNLGLAALKATPFGKGRVVTQFGKGLRSGTVTRGPGLAAGFTRARYATRAPFTNPVTAFSNAGKIGKAVQVAGAGAGAYGYNDYIQNAYKNNLTASSVLPGNNVMSPEAVAANRNRTDAAGNSGMGGRNTVYTDGVRPPGGVPGARPELNVGPPTAVDPAAPIAQVPMPALNPLSPEELGQYGEDLTAIDKLYKQTLADIAQDEEQGQLGYARVGQAAQRRAAGAAVDIGNQLVGSGIGSSPAAAFGAEQMVQAPLVQQRQANRLNLDQLLAQLQKQKTQAGTAMDMSKVGLNRWMTQQRAANTRSQIESGYRNSLGGM